MRAIVYEKERELDASQFADYLDPATTAVISIDMHRGHLDDSPECPCPAPRARDVVAPIDAFHDEVRALGGRIVHVKSTLRPDGVGDMRVENKRRLSAFYPTDLDFLLRNQRITTVVLDGGFTDCCVLNTAFDANNHNYRVIVLRDLVRGTDPQLEAAALTMVSLHLGLVMESLDLLTQWRS